ncbi:MAG: hypothetical protein ABEI97_01185, partial [Candidatus Nanohaloarchaea archaeon]
MARPALAAALDAARSVGLYAYILPFLVTFLIVFGILEKVKPFGPGKDRVHGLFAAVTGLFLVAFAPGSVLGSFFTNFLGAVSVALVGLLMLMIAYGLVFGQPSPDSSFAKGLMALGVVAAALLFIAWGGVSLALPRDFFLY